MERIFDCHLNEMTPDNYNGKTAPLAASVFSCGAGMTNRQFGKRGEGGGHMEPAHASTHFRLH